MMSLTGGLRLLRLYPRLAARPQGRLATQGIETTHEDIPQGSDRRVEQKLSLYALSF